ncbi:MAG: Gfo/Idh/MocA family oxidoreductase [Ginsengibacter sp.]
MSTKRRDFLKLSGLAGVGIIGSSFMGERNGSLPEGFHNQGVAPRFNMSGYGAPKLEKVRIGFIGLGMRGPTHVYGFSHIKDVEVIALCDIRPKNVEAMEKQLAGSSHKPTSYSGDANAWKKMCDRDDIDLIVIATPWGQHVEQAVYAMNAGKHVAIEVPAAVTLKECWQLVNTSEKTKKHCMMMENCCYDFFEIMTLNMARQGYFGDLIHGEGAYIHDLLGLNFNKNGYWDMWRLKENYRNGNIYPTHGLGPIAQAMNINRGDTMLSLTSTSGADFSMEKRANELAAKDPFFQQFANKKYRGNMNITNIKTEKGRTITLYHDVSTPTPYSRIHLLVGTKTKALKYPEPARISDGESWVNAEEMKKIQEKYTPQIVKSVGEKAKKIGGHGGMDFLMQWHLIDCLRNGLPLSQDVYDAALWSAISPLSEWSVARDAKPIKVPDFTGGNYKTNAPVELELKGGDTQVVASICKKQFMEFV